MTATEIAAALGDARRDGYRWRCRCPLHGGRSLVLCDGNNDRVLVTCWGGCDRRDVLAELQRRGFLGRPADYAPRTVSTPCYDDTSRTTRGLNICMSSVAQ
jgi:hypothetical protein